MNEESQRNSSQRNQRTKIEFALKDIVRFWNIPFTQTAIIAFLFFFLYVLPILVVAFKIASVNNLTAKGLDYASSQLKYWEENSLTAFLLSGVSLLTFLSLIVLTISITKQSETVTSQKIKETLFRWIVSILMGLFFPLSMVLTGTALKQTQDNPLITVVCLLDLIFLYILGVSISKNEGVDLISSSNMAKIKADGDHWILIVKILVSSFFHLSLTDNKVYILIILFVSLLISLLELYNVLLKIKFINSNFQTINTIVCLLATILILESILIVLINSNLIRENFEILTIVLFVFSYFSVKTFKDHKKRTMILVEPHQLTSEQEAIAYILEIIQLGADGNHEAIERPFVINNHLKQCSNVKCFCHFYQQQSIHKLARSREFVSIFVLQVLQKIRRKFPSSVTILSIFLEVKLRKEPYFSRIQELLKELKNRKVGFEKTYAYYQFRKMIQNQFSNEKIKKDNIPLENAIRECEQEVELKECIGNIIENMKKKYHLLAQEIVQLEEVTDIGDIINNNIRTIQTIKMQYCKSKSLNILLDPLFMIYYRNLITSPIEAKRLKQIMYDKLQRNSSINKKNSLLMMYTNKSCVFESIFNENLGIISNVSKSVNKVFKFERNDLLGKDINEVMPPFIGQGHKQIVEEWLSGNTLKTSKPIGNRVFIDPCFVPFNCITTTKILSNGRDLRLYKLVVRNSEADCMVISQDGRIEAIGQAILDMGIAKQQDLHTNIQNLIPRSQIIGLEEDNQKKWIQVQKNSDEDSEVSDTPLFDCCISKREQRFGQLSFVILSFLDIRKITVSENKIFQEVFRLNSLNVRIAQSIKNQDICKESKRQSQQQAQRSFQESICKDKESSFSALSSIKKEDSANIVMDLKQKTCYPETIILRYRNFTSIALILCILVASVIFIIQENMIKMGFMSLADILQASTTTNNRNTILEVLYDNSVMKALYCDKPEFQEKCDHLHHFGQHILVEFYESYAESIKSYFSQITFFKKLKLSEALKEPVTLHINNQSITVTSSQLLQTAYGWFKDIQLSIENHESAIDTLKLVSQNYENIKYINKKSISFFNQAGQSQLTFILQFYFLLMGVVGFLICTFICVIRFYFGSQRNTKIELLDCYRHVNRKTASLMFSFFSQKSSKLKNHPQLQQQNTHEGISNYEEQSSQHNYFLITLIIIAIPLTFYMIYPVVTLYVPTSKTLNISTALYESENYLLESYFDLKSFYMGLNLTKTQNEIESEILSHLNQTQLQFARIIRSTLVVFSKMDETFGEEFNKLITQSVCNFTSQYEGLNENEVQICAQTQNRDILDRGIMSILYFFLRNTKNGVLQLKNLSEEDKDNYLQGVIFEDMDNFIFFVMKMMGLIENRINEAFMKQVLGSTHDIFLSHITSIILATIIVIIWFLYEKREKQRMSNIYGYVLQLPYPVLAKKHLTQKIKSILLIH